MLKIEILTFRYVLHIIDTAGDFSGFQESYMMRGDGFLLVYSITSEDSFSKLISIHEDLVRVKGAVCPHDFAIVSLHVPYRLRKTVESDQ